MSDASPAPKDPKDPRNAASHEADEDALRSPFWLPFAGLGLLAAGALASYLWVYPGVNNVSTPSDGGDAGDAAIVEGGPPTAQPAQAAPSPGMPNAPPIRVMPQPGGGH